MEDQFLNIMRADIVKSEDTESDTILPDRYHSEISDDSISLSLRCRLCAMANNDMVDVFSPDVKGHNIIEKIELCLCIMVTETDTLPKRVCLSCLEKLEICYNFNEAVAEAEKQLLDFDRLQPPGKVAKTEICETSSLCNVHCDGTDRCHVESTFQTEPITDTTEETNLTSQNTHNLKKVLKRNSTDNEWYVTIPWRYDDIEPQFKMDPDVDIMEETRTVKVREITADNKIVKSNKLSTIADTTEERNLTLASLKPSPSQTHCATDLSKVRKKNSIDDERCIAIPWRYDGIETPLEIYPDIDVDNESKTTEVPEVRVTTTPSHHDLRSTYESEGSEADHRRSQSDEEISSMHSERGSKNMTNSATYIRERRYKCNLCVKTFSSKKYLNRHNKYHTGEGLFDCDSCEKQFTSRSERSRHYIVHTGQRPFKCFVCKMTFSFEISMKRHAVVHSEVRNYPCSLCDISFKTAAVRKKHMLVHSSKQKWHCDNCETRFKCKDKLRRHMREVHFNLYKRKNTITMR